MKEILKTKLFQYHDIAYRAIYLTIIFFFSISNSFAQKYYLNKSNIYSNDRVSNIFKETEKYRILVNYTIDRNNDNEIDEENVKKFLLNGFTLSENTLLIINWEGKLFDNYIYYARDHKKFKEAESKFLRLVFFIRKFRPHLTLGFYGIPFRNYNPKIKNIEEYEKFGTLISNLDVLAPSMYIPHSDDNYIYQRDTGIILLNNLSEKYKKDVIPLVWNTYYPDRTGKKKFIKPSVFKSELKYIYNSYKGNRLRGFILWEPDNTSFGKSRGINSKEAKNLQTQYLIDFFQL